MFRKRHGRWRSTAALIALLSVCCALVAGCGSSTTATKGKATKADLAAAQRLLAQGTKRPTSIKINTPFSKPIPKGKKVAYISCGLAICQAQGKIVAQGAHDLGWTSESISTDGSPQQLQQAFTTALRTGANAILINGLVRAQVAAQIQQAKKQGVYVAACCSTEKPVNGITYTVSTAQQNTILAKYVAAKIVVDTKGNADTLFVNIPSLQIFGAFVSAFKQEYRTICPGCGYSQMNVALSNLGNGVPNMIVSYLRAHPSINYVALVVDSSLAPGLPAAMKAAGLSDKVKVIGNGSGPLNFEYVRDGGETATTGFDAYTNQYLELDAVARAMTGQPIPTTEPPEWLITKQNVPPSSETQNLFPIVKTYRQQFQKLWAEK